MNDRPNTTLTILKKNDLFSFLGLVRAELVDDENEESESTPITAVVKLDPREGAPLLKQYDTRSEALRNYEEAISTSIERGWSVVYRGHPLFG